MRRGGMDQQAINELIDEKAKSVARDFQKAADDSRNEAEFRSRASKVIELFADAAELNLIPREEYTLLNGRADAVYNRFIIEYKDPGSLRDSNRLKVNTNAIAQLKGYLSDLTRLERHKAERLAGVAFDGRFFIFVRQKDRAWQIDDPLPVTPGSAVRFLRTLSSLSTELALIPDNLVRDFGERSYIAANVVGPFYAALSATSIPRVKKLFEQWSRQFSEVCDYDQASKLNVSGLAVSYGVKAAKQVDPFRVFFCIHTYYAVLIKLLAVQITHFYLMPRLGTDLAKAATFSSDDLLKYLRRMEEGGIFRELGINNFLEGDFFGWYLDVWTEAVETTIRGIISTLSNYSLVTLDVDPDATRDLLKNIYQNLMPKPLRHNLGEYYTPDWLAERTLNMLEAGDFKGDPKKRILDPACGSGTFLVIAIKRIREYGWKHTIPEADLLEMILHNVVGFDLNPLAVISARTNYLLALGDLLQHSREPINIPVYLCDSIKTPSEGEDLFGKGICSFPTVVGDFSLPTSLVDARYIDKLANILEDGIRGKAAPAQFREKILNEFPLDPSRDERDIVTVENIYAQLQDLDSQGINGIWSRIIKNAFAPLFAGKFDYVVGNPPWINWRHLPEQYRQDIAPLWQRYNLFTHKGMRARLGSAMDDISALMFYVSADRYLRNRGRIGFVITQTLFKTEGGGEGFRRFRLGKDGPGLRVLWLDDMSRLKPFEGAANRTAVVLAEKGAPTRYPVAVGYWRKRAKRTPLPQTAGLSEVASSLCRMSQWQGEPIEDSRIDSPWISGRPKSIRAVKRIVGESHYPARVGTSTWLSSVYWVDVVAVRPDGPVVVSNCDKIGRKHQDNVQSAVESDSVFRLLRGENVSRWHASPSLSIVLAQDPNRPSVAIPEATLKRQRPHTLQYFQHFEDALRKRSGYIKYLEPNGAPFYAIYNVGGYTFSPWKVIWREVSNEMDAAVVGRAEDGIPVIPDHTLVFIPCNDQMEAHMLCALLNSSPARFIVQAYVALHPSPHVMKYIPLPKFDRADRLHTQLARSSEDAHKATRHCDPAAVERSEADVDELAAELWRLSKTELKDIHDSLKDLME
jgi:SAM-dependent methyltransferase